MSNKIFVIKNDTGIVAFYADLEKGKNELKNIYKIHTALNIMITK
jgi:hypothetical protein